MSNPSDFDDLWLKTQSVNHLASTLERQAAAGATLPTLLRKRVAYLNHLTDLLHQTLPSLVGHELAQLCQVVYVAEHRITIAVSSMTGVNHLRYLQNECLNTLKQHPEFGQYHELNIILNAHQSPTGTPKKITKNPLSENTKHTITQYANHVIRDETLRKSLLNLIDD